MGVVVTTQGEQMHICVLSVGGTVMGREEGTAYWYWYAALAPNASNTDPVIIAAVHM